MAAVASTDVTYVRGYERGDRTDKFIEKVKVFDVVFSSNGATSGDVLAALFGYTYITKATVLNVLVSSTNTWFVAQATNDGAQIYTYNPANATDATRTAAANITGTVRLEVCGY